MNTKCHSISLATLFAAAAVLGSLLAGANPARAAQYVVTDLGHLGAQFGEAMDVNNYGQVAGYSYVDLSPSGNRNAFLWTPTVPNGATGSMLDLGRGATLPGQLNDFGQVIFHNELSPPAGSGFLWTPTTPNSTAGDAVPISFFDVGDGINNRGQMVRRSRLWTPSTPNGSSGTISHLEPLQGTTAIWASGINSIGQVVGLSDVPVEPYVSLAFLWTPAEPNGDSGTMVDLGHLPGLPISSAWFINDRGQVLGSSFAPDSTESRTFLWTPDVPGGSTGTMIDLGVDGCLNTCGINVHGHVVVGQYLYTPEAGLVDLNTLIDPLPGLTSLAAYSINDFGQIAGMAWFGSGFRPILLTPVSIAELPGDFNHNGTVDAADYVVWRKGLGTSYTQAHYDVWRANFGQTLSAGSGAALPSADPLSVSVPEPATALLLVGFTMFATAAQRCSLTRNPP